MFSEHLFHRTGLGAASGISWEVMESGMEPWTPIYLLWINNSNCLEQFKQKFM